MSLEEENNNHLQLKEGPKSPKSTGGVIPAFVEGRKQTMEEWQENTRARIAIQLMYIFGFSIFGCFFLVLASLLPIINNESQEFHKNHHIMVKDFTTLVLTTEVAILGTALGFYFGGKK